MSIYPDQSLPECSEETLNDALFHYTTADGLLGIFLSGTLRSTAYYCVNDEQELSAGKGVLTSLFRDELGRLQIQNDPRLHLFHTRGVNPRDYADNFESFLLSWTLRQLCAYITCFCIPSSKEDYYHGLLSQWRGYGPDGGYAIQFSRSKLIATIEQIDFKKQQPYKLESVSYNGKSKHREELLTHQQAFIRAFHQHLDDIAKPISGNSTWKNPVSELIDGPLESLLDYLIQTKSSHFAEEKECRLSLIESTKPVTTSVKVDFFNRNGLLVPYVTTPPSFNILDCIEWVIVGPGPRNKNRRKSVVQLIRQCGKNIRVRASRIPYTRQ